MKHFSRYFSVPILDEPFVFDYTQRIYDEQEVDLRNENNGKPFDSFIVASHSIGSSSGYIRDIEKAEKEVEKRIEEELAYEIEHAKYRLVELEKAYDKLKSGGIKAFEVNLA